MTIHWQNVDLSISLWLLSTQGLVEILSENRTSTENLGKTSLAGSLGRLSDPSLPPECFSYHRDPSYGCPVTTSPQGLSPHSKTGKDSQDLWLPWCGTSSVPNHLWPQDSSPVSRDTFPLHVPILKTSAWESNIPPNDLKKEKKLWQHRTACRILVPWPGIEPKLPAVKALLT